MTSTIGYGVSETLLSIFDGLRQTTTMADGCDDAPRKYRCDDIDRVAQYICCRNYGFLCRELCFLSWAIVRAYPDETYQEPLFSYFWLDGITRASAFRKAFSTPWQENDNSVEMQPDVLHLCVSGTRFDISPTRAGVLAVMMEFMASIAPSLVNNMKAVLSAPGAQVIDTLSKQMQKAVYDYLKLNMPEVQEQNRYRYVTDWLSQTQTSYSTLGDDDILRFWQDANDDVSPNKPSHVRFDTAVDDILDTLFAISVVQAQKAIKHGDSVGSDSEQGEVDLDRVAFDDVNGKDDTASEQWVQSALFSQNNETPSPVQLTAAPKCLTKAQAALCEPLHRHKTQLARFALTLIRVQVFGQWQAVLSQAKRTSAAALKTKLASPPEYTYPLYHEDVKACQNALTYSTYCLHHVLLPHEPKSILAELIMKLPTMPAELQRFLSEQMRPATSPEDMQCAIAELRARWPDFAALLADLEKAFKTNNKAGFKIMPDSVDIDPYLEALACVNGTKQILAAHVAQMDNISDIAPLDTLFASDVSIFTDRFNQLYGEVHVAI
ncbi:hypothetical protein [Aestuariibacter sp. A3R04]|uniref:hypothetical protein n=1 Tax=Aestuariibacter sp. A3R04 TaxID=2841571 RepID=UPI001C0A3F18|nr:hypothetical protein [Aestuariibacter sp. A3R04]MBU3020519.1 hypothetical protein [Aestuariibacter sp. A3R04]